MRLRKLLLPLAISLILLAACSAPVTSPTPAETPTPTAPTSSTEPTQALPKEEKTTPPEEEEAPSEEETKTEEKVTRTPTPTPTPTPTKMPTPIGPAPIPEGSIPIIDAHSQFDQYVNLEKIIQLMDEGGVAGTILSTRGTVTPEELASFADSYAGRIVPAVRTKAYMDNDEKYYQLLKKQVNMEQYGAMAEVLMYHAQKGDKAPLVVYDPDDEKVQAALDYALDEGWPFIAHIEFVAAGSQRDEFMTKFEALLIRYPEHPFVLIHMGQLDCAGVRRLIEAHPNIYFITARTTNVVYRHYLPTNMFDGEHLAADWKQLMVEHPDRFIMGFDMVWAEDWGQFYLDEIAIWREAMKELPVEVAHAFAHGNAECLWQLKLVE